MKQRSGPVLHQAASPRFEYKRLAFNYSRVSNSRYEALYDLRSLGFDGGYVQCKRCRANARGFPAALLDAADIEDASVDELLEAAERLGVDPNGYVEALILRAVAELKIAAARRIVA